MKRVFGTLSAGGMVYRLENRNTLVGRAPTSHIVIQA